MMNRLFQKGQRVRSKRDGKVMEVLHYIKERKLVECAWYDMEKKEVRNLLVNQDELLKAS